MEENNITTNSSKDLKSMTKWIVGVVLVSLVTLVTLVIFNYFTNNGGGIDNVRITNLTANSATISWTTESEVKGNVIWDEDNSFLPLVFESINNYISYDDRDVDQDENAEYVLKEENSRTTHHVTLRNLEPETDYYFRVGDGGRYFGNEVFNFTTLFVSESVYTPDPMYGKVLEPQKGEMIKDGIVYYQIQSVSNEKVSNWYSTTISNEDTFSADIGNSIMEDGSTYIPKEVDSVLIESITAKGGLSFSYPLIEYKPLPSMTLDQGYETIKDYNLNTSNSLIVPVVFADSSCGGAYCGAPVSRCVAWSEFKEKGWGGCADAVGVGEVIQNTNDTVISNPESTQSAGGYTNDCSGKQCGIEGVCKTGPNPYDGGYQCVCSNGMKSSLDTSNKNNYCSKFITNAAPAEKRAEEEFIKSNGGSQTVGRVEGSSCTQKSDCAGSVRCIECGYGLGSRCAGTSLTCYDISQSNPATEISTESKEEDSTKDTSTSLSNNTITGWNNLKNQDEVSADDSEVTFTEWVAWVISFFPVDGVAGSTPLVNVSDNWISLSFSCNIRLGLGFNGTYNDYEIQNVVDALKQRGECNDESIEFGVDPEEDNSSTQCTEIELKRSSGIDGNNENISCANTNKTYGILTTNKPTRGSYYYENGDVYLNYVDDNCELINELKFDCPDANNSGNVGSDGVESCKNKFDIYYPIGTDFNDICNRVAIPLENFVSGQEFLSLSTDGKEIQKSFVDVYTPNIDEEGYCSNPVIQGDGIAIHSCSSSNQIYCGDGRTYYSNTNSIESLCSGNGSVHNGNLINGEAYYLIIGAGDTKKVQKLEWERMFNYEEDRKCFATAVQKYEFTYNCADYETANSSNSSIILSEVLGANTSNTIDPGVYNVNIEGFAPTNLTITEEGVSVIFFEDLNGDDVRQENERILEDISYDIALEKTEEVVNYNLVNGWNLLGFKGVSEEWDTASELIATLNIAGANVTHISTFVNGEWQMYSARISEDGEVITYGDSFEIVPGRGYFVKSYSSKQVNLTGRNFKESVPINTSNGWNLISIQSETNYTADSLLNACTSQSLTCDSLARYQSGLYEIVVKQNGTLFGNDFDLNKKSGYFLRVTNGGGVQFTP